ncbi:hypothetical protein [Caldimonas tepidiphila]|uniref:hypothetical protein n=1 Tax=Caldimonas tepidiphila TaxID=2315841 RepID=UPI0013008132|nr:hypothetical protein [Caldimonas tepidiphila]
MLIAALIVFVVLATLLAVGLLRGGGRLDEGEEEPDAWRDARDEDRADGEPGRGVPRRD